MTTTWHKSTCPFCGFGCGVEVGLDQGRIAKVRGLKGQPANNGSNNVECSTRICMASTAAGFVSTLGADAPPTCYADIEEADLFLVAGSNMAVSTPVLFRRISAARKKNAAGLIVVDRY